MTKADELQKKYPKGIVVAEKAAIMRREIAIEPGLRHMMSYTSHCAECGEEVGLSDLSKPRQAAGFTPVCLDCMGRNEMMGHLKSGKVGIPKDTMRELVRC